MRKVTPILFFCIFTNLKGFSQLIEINPSSSGCGNSISSTVPSKYDDWTSKTSWSASIYNKKNFNTNSSLAAIEYFIDCGSCNYGIAKNQKIYLGHISKDQFSNVNIPDNDPDITNLTLVHSGDIQWNAGQWNKIIFNTTSFNYDNTKNLIVYFVNEHGGKLVGGFFCGNPIAIVETFGANTTKYANTSSSSLPATGYLQNQGPIIKVHANTITSLPVLSMEENRSVCSGEKFSFSKVHGSDYTSLKWISSDGGTFNNDTILNPTYTPRTNNGTVLLTLTATNNSGSSSKNFILTVLSKPTANIIKK
ncbi:hypothetical protein TMP248_20229 [Tenacibaculum maritimum]|uniref:hypothetical protein n=1 Tax=Tenacibaculum maritimum TaxID=107401 RepID=UPI0012E609C3|nr:hypothetical protein [Tenacibaculum maritimum]CAA0148175.1 hypothetical protein NACSLCCMFF_10039 [Tenacibaculum maritimum]CAA0197603.1 hypothetical protein TMP248_20229 [Tenacibaculum maritimum]CAA0215368.1 hypothetical protein FS0810_30039 [Tenacibaculum maritimum]